MQIEHDFLSPPVCAMGSWLDWETGGTYVYFFCLARASLLIAWGTLSPPNWLSPYLSSPSIYLMFSTSWSVSAWNASISCSMLSYMSSLWLILFMGGGFGSKEKGLPVMFAIWLATGLCLGKSVCGWFNKSSICRESWRWWLEWSNSSSSWSWLFVLYKFGLLFISDC